MVVRRYIYLCLLICLASCLSGCFTGIESTPRITAESGKNKSNKLSPEEILSQQIVPQPPVSWTSGKQWKVTDPKIALTFTAASNNSDNLADHIIELIEANSSHTISGDDIVELTLKSDDGRRFFHKTNIPVKDWNERGSYSIPFTVEISVVEMADSLLRGSICYITTPRRIDALGKDIEGQRHVEVTIKGVVPGNHIYPLLVEFVQNDRPDDGPNYVPMTFGNATASTRNFDTLFSFSNPRKEYPSITDANWNLIINSQIAEGMTRDECRLALGTPNSIARAATSGAQLERWSYDNGTYLIFEDGILTKFRK